MAGTTPRFGELIQVQRDLRDRVDHGLVAPIARRIDSAIERGSHGLIHPNVTRRRWPPSGSLRSLDQG
jgi:hypothetical protein